MCGPRHESKVRARVSGRAYPDGMGFPNSDSQLQVKIDRMTKTCTLLATSLFTRKRARSETTSHSATPALTLYANTKNWPRHTEGLRGAILLAHIIR